MYCITIYNGNGIRYVTKTRTLGCVLAGVVHEKMWVGLSIPQLMECHGYAMRDIQLTNNI
jgi:hypothetical protein